MSRRARAAVAAGLLALGATCLGRPATAQLLGGRIEAQGCAAAVGGDVAGSTVSVVCGMPPEQVQAMVAVFTQQLGAAGAARAEAEAQAVRLAAQLGVTREAMVSFFRILGEREVPLERMPTRLGEIAARYGELTRRLAALEPEDPSARGLVERAREAVAAGRYDEADALLVRAKEAELAAARQAGELARQAQEAAARRLLKAAAVEAERGQLALTRLRYREAAGHFAAAAETVPPGHLGKRWIYLNSEAAALLDQGVERGDNAALAAAIERRHALLRLFPREQVPFVWALNQLQLGFALMFLGQREAGPARLEEAVRAHRAALEEAARERDTVLWVTIQEGLGVALLGLGEREAGPARLEEAVAAFRAGLEALTRERTPDMWAVTQDNLGAALSRLGEREPGTARLEEAVTVLRAALQVQMTDRVLYQTP
jgi:tetratricopeptide (TPR) repeat protein